MLITVCLFPRSHSIILTLNSPLLNFLDPFCDQKQNALETSMAAITVLAHHVVEIGGSFAGNGSLDSLFPHFQQLMLVSSCFCITLIS